MFSELQEVKWHPDPDVNEGLNAIVLEHPVLGNLDTPGKRFAYVIKKSRKERFFTLLRKQYPRGKLTPLYTKVKNSRKHKRDRRQKWVVRLSLDLLGNDRAYTTPGQLSLSDARCLIFGEQGTWIQGGRIWMWNGATEPHLSNFTGIYPRVNHLYHIDSLIQESMFMGSNDRVTEQIYSHLKYLLVNYSRM